MSERRQTFEREPLTRSEYISAMVHLYRGEQHRAQVWRTRLDTTTNWAVISMGALLSYAFSGLDRRHEVLVLGMYMIFTMLVFESRRFRFYDVWRNRVRRIEENFYVPILRRDLTSPVENWGFYVAEDLLNPELQDQLPHGDEGAAGQQLRAALPGAAHGLAGQIPQFRFPHDLVPLWVSVTGVSVLYAFILYVIIVVKRSQRPEHVYFGSRTANSIDDVG